MGSGCVGQQAQTALAVVVDPVGSLACCDRARCRFGCLVSVFLHVGGDSINRLGHSFGTKKNKDTTNAGSSSGAADNTSSDSSSSGKSQGAKPTRTSSGGLPLFTGITTGTDGSQVLFSNGSTVTYRNRHGGKWAYDPSNPLLNDAQPNSWTPPLSQPWNYEDRMFGVNVGGW